MKALIPVYEKTKEVVKFFYKQLKLDKREKHKGRKLALTIIDTISLTLFKQKNNIAAKKSIHEIFNPDCSYKTLAVNLNRFTHLALLILVSILKFNQRNSHLVKRADSTEIPVCLRKNGNRRKTMKGLADWGNAGKNWFFGLKMRVTADLERRLLAVRFTSGNVRDRQVFLKLNKDLMGIFVADALLADNQIWEIQRGF